MKTGSFQIPIWRGEVNIYFAEDLNKAAQYAKIETKELENCFAHTVIENGIAHIFIKDDATTGVIAHEATHIAYSILDDRGVPISQENDEPLAYLIEFIVDEILKIK